MPAMLAAMLFACSATDGDTIRCAPPPGSSRPERIRLLGIDAPELRGHCRRGRRCVTGDPIAAKAAIAQALRHGPLYIRRFGVDRFGRTLATVSANGQDLSCRQLRLGLAIYRAQWDDARTIARTCPALAISARPMPNGNVPNGNVPNAKLPTRG